MNSFEKYNIQKLKIKYDLKIKNTNFYLETTKKPKIT